MGTALKQADISGLKLVVALIIWQFSIPHTLIH